MQLKPLIWWICQKQMVLENQTFTCREVKLNSYPACFRKTNSKDQRSKFQTWSTDTSRKHTLHDIGMGKKTSQPLFFVCYTSDIGLIHRICRELRTKESTRNQKPQTAHLKSGPVNWTESCPKKIKKWLRNISESGQCP